MTRRAGRLMPHQRCTLLRPSDVADDRILASERGNGLKYRAHFACLYPSKRCDGQILLHIFGGLGQEPQYGKAAPAAWSGDQARGLSVLRKDVLAITGSARGLSSAAAGRGTGSRPGV
jgi:hypothetical protein